MDYIPAPVSSLVGFFFFFKFFQEQVVLEQLVFDE